MEKQVPFLFMVKPGFLALLQEVHKTYVKNGFSILHEKLMKFDEERAYYFYYDHREKKHFPEITEYMTSDNVYPIILSGPIKLARELLGPTDPAEAHEGQIRAITLFPTDIMRNIGHCSDSEKKAIVEIALTFPEKFGELFPQITEEEFAKEYDYIPREYYPKFAA